MFMLLICSTLYSLLPVFIAVRPKHQWHNHIQYRKAYTHTDIRLTALFPGLPRWAGTRNVKPIWILLKQETVSGSGISLAICKSAPCSRQTTTPAPHHCFFTGRMPFLPPKQQRQSTEGRDIITRSRKNEVTWTIFYQSNSAVICVGLIMRVAESRITTTSSGAIF